jgi:hypothetical protein
MEKNDMADDAANLVVCTLVVPEISMEKNDVVDDDRLNV